MKDWEKRFLSILLCMVLIPSILSACSNVKSEEKVIGSEQDSETVTDSSDTSGDNTELTLWMPPYGSGTEGEVLDLEFWTKQLEPWAEDNKVDLSIEIIPWANYEEKMLTAFSSGEGPDVTTLYSEIFNDYIDMGALEELSRYFGEEDTKNYLHYEFGNLKGGQYGVPYLLGNARVCYFNMDIMTEAGITELPSNWEEFMETAQKIKDAGLKDVMPFAQEWGEGAIGALNDNYWPFYWQAGGEIFDESGTTLTFNDTGAALKAAQYLYELKSQGILSDETLSLSEADVASLFSQGKVAMAILGTSRAPLFDENGVNWDFVDSLEDEKKAIWIAASCMSINSSSQHKELAASLIKYATSAQVMEAFHTELASYPPMNKAEEYKDNEKFRDMYENSTYMHTLPVAVNSYKLCDTLYKNLQLMMMNELSPEEAIQNTIDYYKNL